MNSALPCACPPSDRTLDTDGLCFTCAGATGEPAAEPMYLIQKGSRYYRPGANGYTSNIHEAGRFTREQAEREAAVQPGNISAIPDPGPGASLSDRQKAVLGRLRQAAAVDEACLLQPSDVVDLGAVFVDLLEQIDAARAALPEGAREQRQARVASWVEACFGTAAQADRRERIMRVLEEATELAQAEGVELELVQRVAPVVYSRPAGKPQQEAGGVMVTMLAYAAAAGFSLDAAEVAEIERIHAKTPEHFRQRQAEKAALGISTPPAPAPTIRSDDAGGLP